MTEQEKREKAIEEMAEMVEVFTHGVCSTKEGVIDALERGGYSDIKNLYNAGYRKADEVYNEAYAAGKKDAIIDFVETVKRCLPNEPYLHTWLREIAFGKFGVEVEE